MNIVIYPNSFELENMIWKIKFKLDKMNLVFLEKVQKY
jgi:hypothetical protein